MLFDDLSVQGEVDADRLAERMKMDKKRIYYLAKKCGEFETKEGIIRRKEKESEN
jgi:hypothetical protein